MLLAIAYLWCALFTISIMENIKNIASPVSSTLGVSPQILMSKAAGDAPLSTNMKMIQDLGRQFTTEHSKQKKHLAIYECPICKQPFRASVSAINNGYIKSCHCENARLFLERNTKHGLCGHPLTAVYSAMKQRCLNPNDKAYPEWGGRGIGICDEWKNDFLNFYNWAINNGYKKGLKLDREDNDGDYNSANCRWVNDFISKQNTRIISAKNTSGYRGLTYIKTGRRLKRWAVEIHFNGKKYRLGYYLTPELGAQAYNDFVIAHGTAHPLNIIK
jgi:hypothetical protein